MGGSHGHIISEEDKEDLENLENLENLEKFGQGIHEA